MGEDHAQIMKLQTQSTALQRKTEAETQRLNEMVALARQVEKKIHEQRSDRDRVRSGGVYASKTTTLRATLMNGQLETRRAGLNRKAAQVSGMSPSSCCLYHNSITFSLATMKTLGETFCVVGLAFADSSFFLLFLLLFDCVPTMVSSSTMVLS